MNYEQTLQANLDAINKRKAALAHIDELIQKIKDTEHPDAQAKKQADNVHIKAMAVYAMLRKNHERCQEHDSSLSKETARHIAATEALLAAKPGTKEQTEALEEFLTISNELSNKSKDKQYLGAAMLALGVAIVSAAIALTIYGMATLAPFSILPLIAIGIGIGIVGLTPIVPLTIVGFSAFWEGRSEGHLANQMSKLHGSFFNSARKDGETDTTNPALGGDEVASEIDEYPTDASSFPAPAH